MKSYRQKWCGGKLLAGFIALLRSDGQTQIMVFNITNLGGTWGKKYTEKEIKYITLSELVVMYLRRMTIAINTEGANRISFPCERITLSRIQ